MIVLLALGAMVITTRDARVVIAGYTAGYTIHRDARIAACLTDSAGRRGDALFARTTSGTRSPTGPTLSKANSEPGDSCCGRGQQHRDQNRQRDLSQRNPTRPNHLRSRPVRIFRGITHHRETANGECSGRRAASAIGEDLVSSTLDRRYLELRRSVPVRVDYEHTKVSANRSPNEEDRELVAARNWAKCAIADRGGFHDLTWLSLRRIESQEQRRIGALQFCTCKDRGRDRNRCHQATAHVTHGPTDRQRASASTIR